MEKNEIESIRAFIHQTAAINFGFLNDEKEDNNDSTLTRLSKNQIMNIIRTTIVQFQDAIDNGMIYSLPRKYTPSFNVRVDIIAELNSLIQNLSNQNLPAIDQNAISMQLYLLNHGMMTAFQDSTKLQTENEIKLLRYKNEELNKDISKSNEDLIKITGAIQNLKLDTESIFEKSQIEYKQLNNTLEASYKVREAFDRLEKEFISKKAEFDRIIYTTETQIKTSTSKISALEEKSSKLVSSVELLNRNGDRITLRLSDQEGALNDITTETQKLQEELKKLLTPAIAANLQNTFKIRKKWLFSSTIIWGIITVLLTASLLWYISRIFDNGEFSFDLQKVIVSAIKIIPILTLIYFAIRQFNKARNLEEEYAFKESIATSLMFYAEQIKTKPEEKEALIKTTVEKLYNSPTKSEASNLTLGKNGAELKQILEIIKEVKEIGKQ